MKREDIEDILNAIDARNNVNGNGDHPHALAPYLIDWQEFWDSDSDVGDWLQWPLFASGRGHAVYAGAKTGKSWVVLAAVAALATGRPWLGETTMPPVDVLYLDAEMTKDDLRDRLEQFGYSPADDLSHLHYAHLPAMPGLDTPEGGQTLLHATQHLGARLVVIDTTARMLEFGRHTENDAAPFQAFYRCTGMLLKQAGVAWVRIDHAGKSKEAGQRGSSAKADDVDVVVALTRTDSGVTLTATHRRMSWYPERVDIDVRQPTADTPAEFSIPSGRPFAAGTADAVRLLDQLGLPVDISVRAAAKAVRESGNTLRQAVIADAVRSRRLAAGNSASDLRETLAVTPGNSSGVLLGNSVSHIVGNALPQDRPGNGDDDDQGVF